MSTKRKPIKAWIIEHPSWTTGPDWKNWEIYLRQYSTDDLQKMKPAADKRPVTSTRCWIVFEKPK
jgi:hypothetical protein